MAIIAEGNPVVKYLYTTFEKLTSVPLKHISNIIISSASKGFSGKMTDIEELSVNHRTTIGHFLNRGKWDSESVGEKLSDEVYKHISEIEPIIFISLDDSVNEKHKAHSKAKRPMEAVRSLYSHLKGGFVYGHQVFAAMAGNMCYKIEFCEENDGGKIEKAIKVAESLPKLTKPGFVLMDSWYTCKDIINAFRGKGYHTIGALKTNRVIYPNGKSIQISQFAKTLSQSEFRLVTAKSENYWLYRYVGKINGVKECVVLLTYPENAFGKEHTLRAFVCTDLSLSDESIFEYYAKRWKIEVFFKQHKHYFGFGKYQIRSANGIKRFLLIISLASFYFVSHFGNNLGDAIRNFRENFKLCVEF
jgi:hypothetical protein